MNSLARKYLTIFYILLLAEYARPQLLPDGISPFTEGVTVASNKPTTDVNGGVEAIQTVTSSHGNTESSADSLTNPTITTEGVEVPTEGDGVASVTESGSGLNIEDTITTLGPDIADRTTDSREEDTTDAIKPEPSTTGNENVEPSTTKESTERADTTVSPTGACTTVGNFSNELDCRAYYTCSNTTEGLKRVDKRCPTPQAFNLVAKRCTLDISSCNDSVVCKSRGKTSDLSDNSSYFWCIPRLSGGYHIYHIRCKAMHIVLPQLKGGSIDNTATLTCSHSYDEKLAKREFKILKREEKAKQRNEKVKEKLKKKQQEEMQKQAAKFPTSSNEKQYCLCDNDKDKLSATKLSCPPGTKFHKETRSCTSHDDKQLRLKGDEDNDDNSDDDGDESLDEDD